MLNDCHKAAQWVGKTDEIRFKSREAPARHCKFVKMLMVYYVFVYFEGFMRKLVMLVFYYLLEETTQFDCWKLTGNDKYLLEKVIVKLECITS